MTDPRRRLPPCPRPRPRLRPWRSALAGQALAAVVTVAGMTGPLGAAAAPQGDPSAPQPMPPALRALVPAGQEVLAWQRADLDRDGRDDIVFILQRAGSAPFDQAHQAHQADDVRSLRVALADGRGRLRLAGRNDRLVRCQNCGGTWPEPFDALSAGRGWFEVSHYGGSRWRWSDQWTFVYDPKARDWYLDRMADGADTEADGHQVRLHRRGRHFGALRLGQVSAEAFHTRQRWAHAPPPPSQRAAERD